MLCTFSYASIFYIIFFFPFFSFWKIIYSQFTWALIVNKQNFFCFNYYYLLPWTVDLLYFNKFIYFFVRMKTKIILCILFDDSNLCCEKFLLFSPFTPDLSKITADTRENFPLSDWSAKCRTHPKTHTKCIVSLCLYIFFMITTYSYWQLYSSVVLSIYLLCCAFGFELVFSKERNSNYCCSLSYVIFTAIHTIFFWFDFYFRYCRHLLLYFFSLSAFDNNKFVFVFISFSVTFSVQFQVSMMILIDLESLSNLYK